MTEQRKGEAYSALGAAYNSLNEFRQAMECHEKHLNIAKEVGYRKGKGVAYLYVGDVPRAMKYYKQCLSNAEETGDRNVQGRAYCRLRSCYRALHDLKEAIECYKQHLSIAEKIGNRMVKACAHKGLGHSFWASHSLNEALEHFRCCVKIRDTIRASSISEDELKISFRTQHQFAYTHLWYVLVMLERNDEALYAAERVVCKDIRQDSAKATLKLHNFLPGLV